MPDHIQIEMSKSSLVGSVNISDWNFENTITPNLFKQQLMALICLLICVKDESEIVDESGLKASANIYQWSWMKKTSGAYWDCVVIFF